MRDGSVRLDLPYLWPSTLRLPRRPPKLVYLDLLHWIQLAKALAGHPDGAWASVWRVPLWPLPSAAHLR